MKIDKSIAVLSRSAEAVCDKSFTTWTSGANHSNNSAYTILSAWAFALTDTEHDFIYRFHLTFIALQFETRPASITKHGVVQKIPT